MTVTAWVGPDSDVLIVDVTGADPNVPQTALLKLWAPRSPTATAKGRAGLLAQAGWITRIRGRQAGPSDHFRLLPHKAGMFLPQ